MTMHERRRAARSSRTATLAVICAAAVSCGPATPEPTTGPTPGPTELPPETVVLEWGVSQGLWGTERLAVRADGGITYDFEPVQGRDLAPVHGTAALSSEELEALRRTLAEQDVCSLQSERPGIPDEGMPRLTLAFPDLECSVQLWDGEWRDGAQAGPCAVAVQGLVQRARPDAP
jgi:hypothetical protein